jgi:hypothetical protein
MPAILLNSMLLALALGAAAQPADAVAELKDMQQRGVRALLGGHREEYAAMLAPEWRVTHIDGQIITRDEVLAQMFGAAPSPLADLAVDDLDVRVFGDAAVVTGRTTARGRDGTRVVLRFSDFAVKREGRWVIVASHATQLREG